MDFEEERNQLDAGFMKFRGFTSELRGKVMNLVKLLEEKIRLLGDMLAWGGEPSTRCSKVS